VTTAVADHCEWIGTTCQETVTAAPCTTCGDSPSRVCPAGQVHDTRYPATCIRAENGVGCLQDNCKPDECHYVGDICNCRGMAEKRCVYASGTCFSAVYTSDYASHLLGERITVRPATCDAHVDGAVAVTPTDKIQEAVSKPATVADASTKLANAIVELRKKIDSVTGRLTAAEVSIIIIGYEAPKPDTDGSYKFTVRVTFVPADATITPGADHQRVYCPVLRDFMENLSGVSTTTDCVYTATISVKRDISQSSGTPANYDVSSNAPSSSVNALYGSSASTVVVAFGAALISLFVALFM